MQIQLVGHFDFLLESIDDCHNPGPACYSCPAYDTCENHDDSENDDA